MTLRGRLLTESSPPSITGAQLEPAAAPSSADTLACTALGADSDNLDFTYEWLVNGALVGASASTYTSHSEGDTVQCKVTPMRDGVEGTTATSNSVDVTNGGPSIQGVALTPQPAYYQSGVDFSCTPGSVTDAEGDQVTSLAYAWYLDGVLQEGQSTASLPPSVTKGTTVECAVTALDDRGAVGPQERSAAVVVANTPPVISMLWPAMVQIPTGHYVFCAVGIADDADGDRLDYSYAWSINGVPVEGYYDEVIHPSYAGLPMSRGDVMTCYMTAFDGQDSSPEISLDFTLPNFLPKIATAAVEPNPARASGVPALTCALTGVVDTDTPDTVITVSYVWTVNDEVVAGEGSSTLGVEHWGKEDSVACTATASDGIDNGEPRSSAAITIVNSPPTIDEVTMTPAAPYINDGVTRHCNPSNAVDVDGDGFSLSYAWFLNGELIEGSTKSYLQPYHFYDDGTVRGSFLSCAITATDVEQATSVTTSAPVEVVNAPPQVLFSYLVPSDPEPDGVLICDGTVEDADGDSFSLTFEWTVNGVSVPNETDYIIELASWTEPKTIEVGDVVGCTMTAFDGHDATVLYLARTVVEASE